MNRSIVRGIQLQAICAPGHHPAERQAEADRAAREHTSRLQERQEAEAHLAAALEASVLRLQSRGAPAMLSQLGERLCEGAFADGMRALITEAGGLKKWFGSSEVARALFQLQPGKKGTIRVLLRPARNRPRGGAG